MAMEFSFASKMFFIFGLLLALWIVSSSKVRLNLVRLTCAPSLLFEVTDVWAKIRYEWGCHD